ncbi:hypothetical protein ACLKA6_000046 [Drosophila palustris]
MASKDSVLIASLVHLIFRYCLYITPQSKLKTPGPGMPTVIVFVAVLDIISCNRIIPNSFEDIAEGLKYVVEAVTAIFLLEVSMLFWVSVEHSIYLLAKQSLLGLELLNRKTYNAHETQINGAITYPLSVTILAIACQHTDLHNRIVQSLND